MRGSLKLGGRRDPAGRLRQHHCTLLRLTAKHRRPGQASRPVTLCLPFEISSIAASSSPLNSRSWWLMSVENGPFAVSLTLSHTATASAAPESDQDRR